MSLEFVCVALICLVMAEKDKGLMRAAKFLLWGWVVITVGWVHFGSVSTLEKYPELLMFRVQQTYNGCFVGKERRTKHSGSQVLIDEYNLDGKT